MSVAEIRIEGMHCGGCVNRVSQALQKAGATLETVSIGHARVRYDEAVLPLPSLLSVLNRMGFVANAYEGATQQNAGGDNG